MRFSWRALLAVALLAGFPLLVFAIIAALALLEYFLFQHAGLLALKIAIVVVPITIGLLKALFTIERKTGQKEMGVPVTPEQQPELWALVRELAVEVGTRPPDRISLVGMVNAAVSEDTKWLGLRVSTRRMYIGAPLLAALRRDQLSAVLAHELAHYSNRDTRGGGMTYRGRETVKRVIGGLGQDGWFETIIRALFSLYAKLYFMVASSVCRRQELAADALAARIAGTEPAVEGLREITVLDTTWDFYMDAYVTMAWEAGYLPASFVDGFRTLLTERSEELESMRAKPKPEKFSRYDTHPPTSQRIAALHAGVRTPARPGGDVPALDLLREPIATLDAAVTNGLIAEAKTKARTDWPTLVHAGCRQHAAKSVSKFLGRRGLDDILDVLDAGRLADLGEGEAPTGAGQRTKFEIFASTVRTRLSTVVSLALADVGAARWKVSWSGPAEFEIDQPYRDELPAALDAAIAYDVDTAPLRALLAAARIPSNYRPVAKTPVAS